MLLSCIALRTLCGGTKEKLLQDEVHAFNALLDEEKFDREQQLMSLSISTSSESHAKLAFEPIVVFSLQFDFRL